MPPSITVSPPSYRLILKQRVCLQIIHKISFLLKKKTIIKVERRTDESNERTSDGTRKNNEIEYF